MFVVMLLIFVLDLTLDRKSQDKDPLLIMNSVLTVQQSILSALTELLSELKNMNRSPNTDIFIKEKIKHV